MKLNRLIFVLFGLLFVPGLHASPARNGNIILFQPDGTSFTAVFKGDESTKIKTTSEGHAIIQDKDGWWCYAIYDADGGKCSSGWKVGQDVPSEITSESLQIPYGILSSNGAMIRKRLDILNGDTALKKMVRRQRNLTKADEGEAEETPVKHGLVILASFRDVDFKNGRASFENLLKKEGYSFNGATGCAKEYFDAQFNGKIKFDFHVSEIVTLPKNRAYYGGNDTYGDDRNPAEMIKDACILADDAVDFSLYDDDGDGEVDNVFVFFAGPDEAEGADENCIWSHAWYLQDGAGIRLVLDGKTINRYACTSELTRSYTSTGTVVEYMTSIGTFCHEYSHTFGLPDFYDTDYDDEGGWAAGLWKTSLMDTGNQNNSGNTPPYYNAIERELLGISDPVTLNTTGRYTLDPIDKNGTCYRIDTDQEGEYFLFECRAAEGWDKHIGGSGMLIYHIDRSNAVMERWDYYNTVNADHSHQCADLIEADGRKDSFGSMEEKANLSKSLSGVFFPYGSTTSFTPDGSPSFRFWSGAESPYALVSIKKENSVITFNLIEDGKTGTPPDAVNMSYEAFADAAIIRFESSYLFNGEAQAVWGRKDQEDKEITVTPYALGKYSVTLEGLESSKTYNLKVTFILDGLEGNTEDISFMTKRMPDVDWPYIYLGSMERDSNGHFLEGGRFPMRVYNAADAAEIRWTFNGEKITPEGDGYWTLKGNGTLQALIIWEDGRRETVTKEIITGR